MINSLILDLLAKRSISPFDDGCQALLAKELESVGFHIESLNRSDVSNLWAKKSGRSQSTLLFAGHTDVVPPGSLTNWLFDPFSPTISGDYLYARGAADMKVALCCMVLACKDFIADYGNILDRCSDEGFFKVDSLPSTTMDISFADFDEYLKSLSSVTRSGLKRKFKEVDGKVKIDLEVTDRLPGDVLPEVHALYLQTYERNEIGLEKLTPDFFQQISKNMPNETRFFLWRMDNKLVAFAFCLVSGDYFIDYYLGFDYTVAHKYHLFYVRFRDLMKWCIAHGIKKYEMGQTVYEPKRRLCFDFIPLSIYAKHRNKLFNPVFKAFCRIVQPSNFDPIFKELKKTNGQFLPSQAT